MKRYERQGPHRGKGLRDTEGTAGARIRRARMSFCDSFGIDFWGRLKDDLARVAFNWDEDGAHIEALYVLARLRLVDEGLIAQELRMMKFKPKANAMDYERVEALLSGETA